MARIRVYELAKEIDMDSKILVARLIEHGINVKNYMTMLDEGAVEKAKAIFLSEQDPIEKVERINDSVIRRGKPVSPFSVKTPLKRMDKPPQEMAGPPGSDQPAKGRPADPPWSKPEPHPDGAGKKDKRGHVALFIDWENIKISATKYLDCPPDIILLKKIARRYGEISVARAYANWADAINEGDMEMLSYQNIDPVFVRTRSYTNKGYSTVKGSVDIRMACDCVELVCKNRDIATCVLVSGDAGFEHIVGKIKENGRQAVIVSVRAAASRWLGDAAGEMVYYDDWVIGQYADVDETLEDTAELEESLQALSRIVASARERNLLLNLRDLKDEMKRENPQCEEENFGCPSFRHMAYLAEKRGLIRVDGETEPATAYRHDETKTEDSKPLFSPDEWREFITAVKSNIAYLPADLLKFVTREGESTGKGRSREFVDAAIRSRVLWIKKTLSEVSGGALGHTTSYYLNSAHPRVQVYRGKI